MRSSCALSTLLVWVGAARADVITFDSVPSSGNPALTSLDTQGFNFASGLFHTIDGPALFGGVSNGTVYIAEEGGGVGEPITMSAIGGGTFTLSGFDLAKVFLNPVAGFPNAVQVDVTEVFAGGGSADVLFQLPSAVAFQSYSFTPVTNLTSVTFSGRDANNQPESAFALDNVIVNAVPEPSSLVAISVGVVALLVGFTRSRSRAVARR